MNLFGWLTGVKKVFVTVGHVFILLFGQDASEKFAHAALGLLKSDLGEIVQIAVENAAPLLLSGAEKRSAAFAEVGAKISASASESIRNAPSHIINMLIELCVARLNRGFDVVPQ